MWHNNQFSQRNKAAKRAGAKEEKWLCAWAEVGEI